MDHNKKIAVIGLGYVGLPVAAAFAEKDPVIGFDVSLTRVNELKEGRDRKGELTSEELRKLNIQFTHNVSDLKDANFYIIAVPTPIDAAKKPDLAFVKSASELVAPLLKEGDIVVYESTVYPGVTEEICIPILEKLSGLSCPKEFSVGYSPERINPGDKVHCFKQTVKVVSGFDDNTLDTVANVYGSVVKAGIHRAPSIKIAEAAKVIENIQRDLNVALMNELSLIFDRLGIDTLKVLEVAGTKWNFLPFRPGLVGGHCIGVDPYYLTHKAEELNYHPEVILAGRRINDNVSKFIVTKIIKKLVQTDIVIKKARVAILGLTFKENCPDIRNSKVFDIIRELSSYGIEIIAHDPHAHDGEVHEEYGIKVANWHDFNDFACIIIAVAHQHYRELPAQFFVEKLIPKGQLADIKGIFHPEIFQPYNINYWRL